MDHNVHEVSTKDTFLHDNQKQHVSWASTWNPAIWLQGETVICIIYDLEYYSVPGGFVDAGVCLIVVLAVDRLVVADVGDVYTVLEFVGKLWAVIYLLVDFDGMVVKCDFGVVDDTFVGRVVATRLVVESMGGRVVGFLVVAASVKKQKREGLKLNTMRMKIH